MPARIGPPSTAHVSSKGAIAVARRLLIIYLAVVLGPLALATAAFALRDLMARRGRPAGGNGRAEPEGLEHTVEEVRAP
jgi:hypothetical protein